jgi:hypothetical protein
MVAPETETWIADILGAENLTSVANWADSVTKEEVWSQPLHFINVDDTCTSVENCKFTYERDCLDDQCVAGSIANYTSRLFDSEVHDDYESLKFLVHFIGDVHQPLHCARASDLGGNRISPVHYAVAGQGETWDLHQIWDFGIIENHVESVDGGGQELMGLIDGGKWADELEEWLECSDGMDKGCTSAWGQESVEFSLDFAYVDLDGKQIKDGDDITQEYAEDRWEKVIQKRLLQGGYRLAAVLDAVARTHGTESRNKNYIS